MAAIGATYGYAPPFGDYAGSKPSSLTGILRPARHVAYGLSYVADTTELKLYRARNVRGYFAGFNNATIEMISGEKGQKRGEISSSRRSAGKGFELLDLHLLKGLGHTTRSLLCLLIVIAVFAVSGCSVQQLEGRFAYLLYDETAEELVLVLDRSIYILDPEDDSPAFGEIGRADVQARDMASPPYLYYRDEQRHVIQLFTSSAGETEMWVHAEDQYQKEPIDTIGDIVRKSEVFVPTLFTEQSYRFEHNNQWYSMDVTASPGGATSLAPPGVSGYRYSFELAQLDSPVSDTISTPLFEQFSPGSAATWFVHQDLAELWGSETIDVAQEFIAESLHELVGFFGAAPQPVYIINCPVEAREHVVGYREDSTAYAYIGLRRAGLFRRPPALATMRHELTHLVHADAAVLAGSNLDTKPYWLVEGLAEQHQDRPYVYTAHRLNPIDLNRVRLHRDEPPVGMFGDPMVRYLRSRFGDELTAQYVVHRREPGVDEDEITGEFFGMTQREILEDSLQPTSLFDEHSPDVVAAEWEVLGDIKTANNGFTPSPDGSLVALLGGGGTDIRVLDVQSGETEVIFSTRDHEDMASVATIGWFPDAERIIFSGGPHGGPRDLYVLDAAGVSSPELLVASEAADSAPNLCPEGRYLAFRSERTGHSEIHIKDLQTGDVEQVTGVETYLTWPVWCPAGERLAFADSRREKLGVIQVGTESIWWKGMKPHGLMTLSRPQWLSESEIVMTVEIEGEFPSPVSVDLASGECSTWGVGDFEAEILDLAVVPGHGKELFVSSWLYDEQHNQPYMGGLLRMSFE